MVLRNTGCDLFVLRNNRNGGGGGRGGSHDARHGRLDYVGTEYICYELSRVTKQPCHLNELNI